MDFVYAKHGYISIPNYNMGDCKMLENILSEYDELYHRRIYHGLFFDEKNKELRIPLGFGVNSIAKMLNRTVKNDFNPDEERKISTKLTVFPRDDLQNGIIDYIVKRNAKYSQSAIIAGTGCGKTYCAIAISVIYQTATLIISHSSKLRSHWSKKILGYTDTTEEEVLILDSSSNILKILSGKVKFNKYRYISTTHSVLTSFGKKFGWDKVEELCKILGIGFIIIDEVHRCFDNTIRILTHSNARKYLLLTATFKRSQRKQNQIFHACFYTIPKFEQSKLTDIKTQKHIMGTIVQFNSHPSLGDQMSCTNPVIGGINGIHYVNYLVSYDKEFFSVFGNYLGKCVDGTEPFKGKGMVMCGSIYACEEIAKYIKKSLGNDVSVGVYHSKTGLKQSEKDKLLETSDIVVTTSGSLGEGTDMDKLHYLIDIETYRSEVLAEQIPGRLRNLNDGHNFHYIKIVNIGFSKAYDQLHDCMKIYNQNLGSVRIVKWN